MRQQSGDKRAMFFALTTWAVPVSGRIEGDLACKNASCSLHIEVLASTARHARFA